MIERHYFMSAKINKTDGSGGYYFKYVECSNKGWVQKPINAFNHMLSSVKSTADENGIPHENIEVICFCRC